jgi:hypothetical protein
LAMLLAFPCLTLALRATSNPHSGRDRDPQVLCSIWVVHPEKNPIERA